MKEEHRHIENIINMTKQQVLDVAHEYFYVANTNNKNIDLGVHKHDRETMTVILNSLMKYWYSWHISPDNFIDAEIIFDLAIENLHELSEGSYRQAITKNFDTSEFFKELYKRLLVNGNFKDDYHITKEGMLRNIFYLESYFPECSFCEAKKLVELEEMKKYLPDYSYETEAEYLTDMKKKD